MDGDFGAASGGFGDIDDFASSQDMSLNPSPLPAQSSTSPFVSRSPREDSGANLQLSGGFGDSDLSAFQPGADTFVNGVRDASRDVDPFFDNASRAADTFLVEENDMFLMEGNGEKRTSSEIGAGSGYSPPVFQEERAASQKRLGEEDEFSTPGHMNGVYGLMPEPTPAEPQIRKEEMPNGQPAQNSQRSTSANVDTQVDEQARRAVEAVQEQMRREVEARRREEDEMKREQRELAQEELKDFYERRKQLIERRSKANQAKENESGNLTASERSGSWSRVIQLIDADDKVRSRGASSAGASNAAIGSKDRCKMRELLVELSSQEEGTAGGDKRGMN
ncbi:hypothetical protein BESB_047120 [Besnoitia besnoiti]|uniref:Clathrin light chain n=1 Tax=Besnoitia besnoiti TaxID=94643 RepID=A0A2A9MLZ0_BESBE|nr:hypothetical protein BESB_047120 [Besnoitia besnoiti]PFH36520.1 hypothetical protein BESB_047120 [Besnoitia besnoiti]